MKALLKDAAPALVVGFVAGLALGFAGGLLAPGRREPVKPPTAARMRPVEVPVMVRRAA